MRNATIQVMRSGLGRLSASRPTSAAQRPAISAAVAGSAITGGGMQRDLQSCRRVYRRDRGDDDAIHGDRAVQTGAVPDIYRRLRDQGRSLPEGLTYEGSWIEAGFGRCFQLMACDDARLLQEWVLSWGDLFEAEIVPVVPSAETREVVRPFL